MNINGREVKTVAVDFDGTLFVEEYPEIGRPIWSTIDYVKSLKENGVELILHTNREGTLLKNAIEACRAVGIEFDAVNENVAWRVDQWGQSRKIGADLYIDDKSINPRDIMNASILTGKDKAYWNAYYHNPYFKRGIDAIDHGEADPATVILAFSNTIQESIEKNQRRTLETVLRSSPFGGIL